MSFRGIRKIGIVLFGMIIIAYSALCLFLYYNQTKLLFHPQKTNENIQYSFHPDYDEIFVSVGEEIKIHNVLFKSTGISKGLVFFLHGNAGSNYTWGKVASVYNRLGYDVWMMDYRSFGKSNGTIDDEEQFHRDIDKVFEKAASMYPIENICIVGYSMGTGFATKLATQHSVKKLILLAPYYGMGYLVSEKFKGIPSSILKFPIKTFKYIQRVEVPIYIFHGRNDEVIPMEHSLKLKKYLKQKDMFFSLSNQVHGGIHYNMKFLKTLKTILE